MGAGDRFVEVPAERLEAFLKGRGFERGIFGREVVYRKRHARDPRFVVCVYTSIRAGAADARGLGQDAIRVTAFQEIGPDRTRGIAKCARVYRTGSVEGIYARIQDRIAECLEVCDRRIAEGERADRLASSNDRRYGRAP